MKKQIHISIETLMHKWPVFGIGFSGGEFFVSLWLVDMPTSYHNLTQFYQHRTNPSLWAFSQQSLCPQFPAW